MSVVSRYPRFRTTSRLVQWVRRNRPGSRLPPESERCFFRSKEAPSRISDNLVRYADHVGSVGPELESLLVGGDFCNYAVRLLRKNLEVSEFVLDNVRPGELVSLSGHLRRRFPERIERKIEDPVSMSRYADNVGVLPEEFEELIYSDPQATMNYLNVLGNSMRPVPERALRAMVGHDGFFVKLAQTMGRRLPDYLEESIRTPEVALNYARYVVRGRLPESVEEVLTGDPRMAVRYAFEVVRGFASPMLPPAVHASVVMSVDGSSDGDVRRYIQEVDRLSEKPVLSGTKSP